MVQRYEQLLTLSTVKGGGLVEIVVATPAVSSAEPSSLPRPETSQGHPSFVN